MALWKKLVRAVLFFILIFLLIVPLVPVSLLKAQEEEISSEALSVILIIDVSGSMARTDPEMLRETAANVFIDLLSPEDRLGVITFDDQANVIIPLQRVQSQANKAHIKETLSPNLEPRGYTDFLLALETAFAQFQEIDLEGTHPSVVLLTDGEPNPGPDFGTDPAFVEEYLESVWDVAAGYAAEGIPVYTIGFSDEIDPDFIERLSLDTRGSYYIHDEPTGLVLTFFDLLGGLKNRRGLFQETFTLQEESRTFTIPVDVLTRQVNLVMVPFDGDVQLRLEPPRGTVEEAGSVSIDVQPGYSLGILSQPQEDYWGTWTATVAGTGNVQFMADMDLHLQTWLETPVSGSQHPLDEPIRFRVGLTRSPAMRDMLFESEILVTKPDADPVTVPLSEENGYFTGIYEDVDRTGSYEMQVRILMDGELLSTLSSVVNVRNLPALTSDFWGGEAIRQGDRQLVTASLNMRGQRLPEGPDLQLERFRFVFERDDGERMEVPLLDSGSPEHGDLRAGDGIFSNYLVFEEEGTFEGKLVAAGKYRETEFLLEKRLDPLEVRPPGNIFLSLVESNIWSVPGRETVLQVKVQNDSYFPETLRVEQPEGFFSISGTTFALEPGETETVDLRLTLDENLAYGEYQVPLSFKAENDATGVDPRVLTLNLETLSAGQAFFRNFYGLIIGSGLIIGVLLVFVVVFLGGGLFLYRVVVYPKTKVGGSLEVTRINDESPGHSEPQKLRLWKLKKNPVVISMGSDDQKADFHIENSEFSYDIIIQARWDVRFPRFFQGWKALIERHIPIRVFLKCTPPGIIEHEGKIYTEKELYHSEELETGGFLLRYNNPYGKWYKEAGDGLDVLQGWGKADQKDEENQT